MSLTPEQLERRRHFLTASDVKKLVSGDKQQIYDLWREKINDPGYVRPNPEDWPDHEYWPLYHGSESETLHLNFLQRKLGPITRRGELVTKGWAGATLDGWVDGLGCCVEAKATGGFQSFDTVVARYFPQTTWQMIVTETKTCILSVMMAGGLPRRETITFDDAYAAELWNRGETFWAHVQGRTAPVDIDPIATPVKAIREVDMGRSNAWAAAAADWLRCRDQADLHAKACKTLRELVAADVSRAFGAGIEVTRDRAGRLHIR